MTAARTASLEALLAPLREHAGSSAVLSDVDGTLAPIVRDPADASVPPRTREVLARLCELYPLVACVTGRPALVARRIVGVDGVTYAGNHGLELLAPSSDDPAIAPELAGRAELARNLVAGLDAEALVGAGLRVEDKGPIQALHWRGAPDADAARGEAERVAGLAEAEGLTPHWGRRVLEFRPTSRIDKGTAVRALLAGADVERAMFGGDDLTDLDAFDSLDALVETGALQGALRVGVASDEAPEHLGERADVVVEGTAGFLDALRILAGEG